jgi:hypothetical protein
VSSTVALDFHYKGTPRQSTGILALVWNDEFNEAKLTRFYKAEQQIGKNYPKICRDLQRVFFNI